MGLFGDIYNSFNNQQEIGFSARKLSAFAAVMVCLYVTIYWTDHDNVHMTLGIWLTFALLCLGIVTAEQVIKFKNGTVTETKTEVQTESTSVSVSEKKKQSEHPEEAN